MCCCSEQCIEAYELLLALAETEQCLVLGQYKVTRVSTVGKYMQCVQLSDIVHHAVIYIALS